MYGIIFLLVVALVSLLITRIATMALTVTGMTRESARFQARSALTGAGFTTRESELIVVHPIRRRIVMALMLIGNVGLVTAMAGLLGSFASADRGAGLLRAGLLVVGLAGVYAASRSQTVDRRLSRVIARYLRRYTDLETRDYDQLLHLAGEYAVIELAVEEGHWLVDRTLGDVRLRDEGIVILGIRRRDGSYVGVPSKTTEIHVGDTLIAYGRGERIEQLNQRMRDGSGEYEHREAVVDEQQKHADEPSPADTGDQGST